jgi:hypothetical protein
VTIDGDDDIVSESMIVHCLVGSLRRFATNRVEGPIGLVQVDIRRQRTERTPLRDSNLSSSFDDLFYEMQDLWVLDPRAILSNSTECRIVSK